MSPRVCVMLGLPSVNPIESAPCGKRTCCGGGGATTARHWRRCKAGARVGLGLTLVVLGFVAHTLHQVRPRNRSSAMPR